MCVVWLLLCDGLRPIFWGFGTVRGQTLCSGMTTLDNHNFLARTPIRAFLDSTESLSSLEFNNSHPKCSMNIWLGHGHLRNGQFRFLELLFSEPVCNRNAWAAYGLSRELRVGCFVW